MNDWRRKRGWRAAWPGLAVLAALTVTSAIVFSLDSVRRALAEGPHLLAFAPEARGLQPGAPVWVAGSPAGRIVSIRFRPPGGREQERVRIEAVLNRTAAPYLRRDATAQLGPSALLAPTVLKLDPGSPDEPPFDFSDSLYIPRDTVAQTYLTLARAGKAGIDTLHSLLGTLHRRLEAGPGTWARLRADTALRRRLLEDRDRAAEVIASVRGSEAVRLLADDSVRATVRRLRARLETALNDRTAAAVRDSITETLAAMERVSERLAELEAGLREGRGTAGRAMADEELADRTRMLRAALDSVRSELMIDPLRYLRFRLF